MLRSKNVILSFCLVFCLFLTTSVFGTQTTYTFYPVADGFVSGSTTGGSAQMNQNNGLNSYLRVQNPSSFSHVLLKFSSSGIVSTIGTNHVISANLKLYIETNFNNWSGSTPVDLHRMQTDWGETTSTWMCPADLFADGDADCDPEDQWNGGFYEEYAAATVMHQNNQTGWQSFQIGSEIQLLQNGGEHFGFLIRKRNSTDTGSVDYTSIQGSSFIRPQLEVTIDNASSCTPTIIESVSPAIIPSNGTNQTITITGQGLDRITSILVDGNSISYSGTASLITFVRNYSSTGTHVLSLRSNCLTEPLHNYRLEADTTLYQQALSDLGTDISDMPVTSTNFSRCGFRLCWNGSPVRLIGYTGDFSLLTWDSWWTANQVQDYMKKAQYKPGTGGASRGTNFIRIFAVGGSCITEGGGPGTCKGYGGLKETMPFKWANGEYKKLTSSDFNQLSSVWRNRLKNFIKSADRNGIAVMIAFFDENVSKGPKWGNNPWNPGWNDLPSNCIPTVGNNDSLPAFYQNGPSNCLNNAQRFYVKAITKFLESTNLKICGSSGNQQCRNFFFEVMNEARLETDWSFNRGDLKAWHNTVSAWVKQESPYMVAANAKGKDFTDECDPGEDHDVCLWQACSLSSCPNVNGFENYFQVFTGGAANNIDVVAVHYGSWGEDDLSQGTVNLCDWSGLASKFNKPVIYDDDGDNPSGNVGRDNNCNVENWSEAISTSCSLPSGRIHYYHTGDGSYSDQTNTCAFADNGKIDCQAWNGMADGLPTVLCASGSCPDVRSNYCENKTGGCFWDECDDQP